MLRQFFRDSAIYGASRVLSHGIGVLLIPFYTRVLSRQEYGIVDLLLVTASLVNIVVALEITQGLVFCFTERKDEKARRLYASSAFWFTVGVYALLLCFVFPFARELSAWALGGEKHTLVIQTFVVFLPFQAVQYFSVDLLRWMLQPKVHALATVLQAVVTLGAGIILVFFLEFGVVGVIWAQILGSAVASSVAIGFALRYYWGGVSRQALRDMLSFSLPLVPSSVAVFVSLYVDRAAITRLIGMDALGVYGVGFRFASLAALFMYGFQGAITPLVYERRDEKETPEEIAKIFKCFIAIAGGAIVSLGLFSREILILFATKEYYAAYSLIPVLGAGVLLSQMYVFAPGLALARRTKLIAVISVLAALLNVILNFLMIPLFGIMGAALATLITACAGFLFFMYLSQKFFYVPHEWSRIVLAVLISLVTLLVYVRIPVIVGLAISLAVKSLLLGVFVLSLAALLIGLSEIRRAVGYLFRS